MVSLFCDQCGAQVEEGSKFCENCGATITPETTAPVQQRQGTPVPGTFSPPATTMPSKSPAIPLPFIVGGIVVILVIAAVIILPGILSGRSDIIIVAVPGDGSANDWYKKGTELYELKDYQGALYAFEKSITLDPGNATTWNEKSRTLNELKKYEEALAAIEKAISLNPNSASYWYTKGVYLEYLGRYQEALSAYEKAIALDPDFQLAIFGKNNLIEKM